MILPVYLRATRPRPRAEVNADWGQRAPMLVTRVHDSVGGGGGRGEEEVEEGRCYRRKRHVTCV